jgi:hypothetical protein
LQKLQITEIILMGCKCPDDTPLPHGSCSYLIYSGGPIERLYKLVAQVIPEDAELIHGHPIVHTDGSLEFPGEPPALSGYRLEGSRLCPAWPPCTLRMLRVQVVDGVLSVTGLCGNPKTACFSLEVSLEQCLKCPFQLNATNY